MQSVVGEIYEGKVVKLVTFGAFVKMSNGETGMVHISEVSPVYVRDITEYVHEGQEVKVKVLAVNEDNKISLSIKQALPPRQSPEVGRSGVSRQSSSFRGGYTRRGERGGTRGAAGQQTSASMTFEDMIAKFKQESDEKISVLKKAGDFKGSSSRRSGGR